MKLSAKHTVSACFVGAMVQALVINFSPLLFLTFENEFGISLGKISLLIAISFITKLGSDVCRDASISSAASALELTGILCAALVSMPMLVNMLKMIGEML